MPNQKMSREELVHNLTGLRGLIEAAFSKQETDIIDATLDALSKPELVELDVEAIYEIVDKACQIRMENDRDEFIYPTEVFKRSIAEQISDRFGTKAIKLPEKRFFLSSQEIIKQFRKQFVKGFSAKSLPTGEVQEAEAWIEGEIQDIEDFIIHACINFGILLPEKKKGCAKNPIPIFGCCGECFGAIYHNQAIDEMAKLNNINPAQAERRDEK